LEFRFVEASQFVFPHSADDPIGEVAFMASACFARGFPFAGFPVEVDLRLIVAALLGDACDVEDTVDSPVSLEVEAVTNGFS
jgi:hypothetical protein